MRIDKLTTQFQQALGEAQSLALANDNQYIDPLHVLVALTAQSDGSGKALLERAGVRTAALKSAAELAIKRLPQVSGAGGEIQVGRELVNLLNLAEKESMKQGDQFVATEMFLLVLADDKGEAGRVAREAGLARKPLDAATHEFFARAADVVITLEDHVAMGGYGSIVNELFADRRITTPVVRMGWPDVFVEHASSVDYLRQKHGLTVDRLVADVLAQGQAASAHAAPVAAAV